MARKTITDLTLKKLFSLSGNNCAFPDCKHKIVDKDFNLIAEVCHIEAAEIGGQRYNHNQNDEERRNFENLIILCPNHHKVTDDEIKYTVEKLKLMKITHQNRFIDQEYTINDKTLEQAKSMQNKITKKNEFYKSQQIIAKKGNIIINYNQSDLNNNYSFINYLFKSYQNISLNLNTLLSKLEVFRFIFNTKEYSSKHKMKYIPEGLNKINITSLFKFDTVNDETSKILKQLSKKNANESNKSTSEILKSRFKTNLSPKSKQIVHNLISNLEKSDKTDLIQIEKVTQQNSKDLANILTNLNKAKSNLDIDDLKKIKEEGLNLVEKQKAEVCYTTGKAYLDLLMFSQAKINFLEALELDPANFKILNQLFSLAIHLEDFEIASSLVERVTEEKNKTNDIHKLSDIYNNLALYYYFLGDYNKSVELYNELNRYLQFSSTVDNHEIHGVVVSIALILLIQGKATEAYDCVLNTLQATLPNFNSENPPEINDLKIARLYNCISISYAIRGQLDRALKYSKLFKNIQANLAKDGYTNPYVLTLSYLNYSTLQFYKGNLQEAQKLTYIAKDFIQDNIGNDFSLLANTYSSFGGILLLKGEEKKAVRNFTQALEILNSQNSRGSLLKSASILCHQGNVYSAKGEKDKSNQIYESAINILGNFFENNNPNLVRLNFNLQNPNNTQNIILAF